jgi:hypothetical protein
VDSDTVTCSFRGGQVVLFKLHIVFWLDDLQGWAERRLGRCWRRSFNVADLRPLRQPGLRLPRAPTHYQYSPSSASAGAETRAVGGHRRCFAVAVRWCVRSSQAHVGPNDCPASPAPCFWTFLTRREMRAEHAELRASNISADFWSDPPSKL